MVRVVVVVAGCVTTHSERRTALARLTRFTDFTRALRLSGMVEAFAVLTMAGRDGGFSATWTAPPPRIAPPAVQAASFARAIFTDIATHLLLRPSPAWIDAANIRGRSGLWATDAKESLRRKRVNHEVPLRSPYCGPRCGFRANWGQRQASRERIAAAAARALMVNAGSPAPIRGASAGGAEFLLAGPVPGQKCHGFPPNAGEFLTAI